ncbi:hypothetical protein [Falsiroseomonas sp.]|uniref:hypothetical protein n=1 Tax=Falsiroseomonas sp. TaxID=2870721 RepID=UPI0027352C5E|nr:hypothetical protein [Falsiroseomonas sp.]MDP3417528.1 hypothetical protein [Falsiroseomonas sp.]
MSADHENPSGRHSPRGGRGWQDLAGSWGRTGQAAATRGRAGSPCPAGKAEMPPAHGWAPAEGDATFTGQPAQDVLALRGVTLTQLIIAINVLEPGLSLHLDRDGGLGFNDQSGAKSRFSGNLTIRGATLRFAGVTTIILV